MSNTPQRDNKPPNGPGGPRPGFSGRGVAFWLLLVLLLVVIFQWYTGQRSTSNTITFSAFAEQVESGNVAEFTIVGEKGVGRLGEQVPMTVVDGTIRPVREFTVVLQRKDDYYEWLREDNPDVRFEVEEPSDPWLTQILTDRKSTRLNSSHYS